jgi:hypothetical protein
MKLLITTIFIFFFALAISAQSNCVDIADCQAKLSEASRMINKLLDVSKSKDDVIGSKQNVIDAKTAEIESRKSLESLNEQLLAKQKEIMSQQDSLIKTLTKQNQRRVSFAWGLVKITY